VVGIGSKVGRRVEEIGPFIIILRLNYKSFNLLTLYNRGRNGAKNDKRNEKSKCFI